MASHELINQWKTSDNNLILQPPADLMKSVEYGAIVVLRTLLLKIYRPEDWQKILCLEHHNDDRKNLPLWNEDEIVAKVIREQWNLGELFSEDEIHIVSSPVHFDDNVVNRHLLSTDMWNL